MSRRVALLCVALAGGAFALGRASVDTDELHDAKSPEAAREEGRAAGLREGRALQIPASGRRAFRAGYVAGANDVFGGFDGGWSFGAPYVIRLVRGGGGVTYRIDSRRAVGE